MTLIDVEAPVASILPAPTLQARPSVIVVAEQPGDVAAREDLLDAAFGAARFGKTSQKLRQGRLPARGLALVARLDGAVVGTVRLWHVAAGSIPALLLGPLAVDDRLRAHGIGTMLMRQAIDQARILGHRAIVLVGDAPYYARFGFRREHALGLRMPGPVDAERFLGLELQTGTLREASGVLRATGAIDLAGEGGRATRSRIGAVA